jgi:hypothetical protein
MIRLARFFFGLSCLALGCAPGSAFCKWLAENNAAVQVSNGQYAVDLCTNQVTAAGQAVEPA